MILVLCPQWTKTIERFHSRGEHLCKFIGTKESIFIRKSSTPTGFSGYTSMAAVSLFGNTNMAAVTSCENALLPKMRFEFSFNLIGKSTTASLTG